MTIINSARSAAVAVTENRPQPRILLSVLLLAGALAAAGAGRLSAPASARAVGGGSVSVGSSGAGRMVSGPMMGPRRSSARRAQPMASVRRFGFRREDFSAFESFERAREFRRFHHRDGDEFTGGFLPFGFFAGGDWPATSSDLSAMAAFEGNDDGDWRGPPFWVRSERYERPTVEKTPSGVTIIRGPGSHHFSP